jgi:hypothetical protein
MFDLGLRVLNLDQFLRLGFGEGFLDIRFKVLGLGNFLSLRFGQRL